MPSCAVMNWLIILASPDIRVKAQIGICYYNLFQNIEIVLSFSNKFDRLWNAVHIKMSFV